MSLIWSDLDAGTRFLDGFKADLEGTQGSAEGSSHILQCWYRIFSKISFYFSFYFSMHFSLFASSIMKFYFYYHYFCIILVVSFFQSYACMWLIIYQPLLGVSVEDVNFCLGFSFEIQKFSNFFLFSFFSTYYYVITYVMPLIMFEAPNNCFLWGSDLSFVTGLCKLQFLFSIF